MKRISVFMACTLVGLGINLPVQADNTMKDSPGHRACLNIASACEDAGYRMKQETGKNIWKDCLKPIIAGQTISGVTVDPQDIQICKKHDIAWERRHKNMNME